MEQMTDDRVKKWLTDVCGVDVTNGMVRRVEIIIPSHGAVQLNVYRLCPSEVFDGPLPVDDVKVSDEDGDQA